MTPSPVTAQARVKSVFGDLVFLLKSWMIILAVFFLFCSLNDQGNIEDGSLLLVDTYFNVQDRECIWLV